MQYRSPDEVSAIFRYELPTGRTHAGGAFGMRGDVMRGELALPAFALDCRDWWVITPSESGLPDEVAGAPLLAVLSTVVLDSDDFRSVSAVLTVGLLDDDDEVASSEPFWL